MERARFKAGRDAGGTRVGGTYSNRIRWQIPDGYQSQLASAGFSVDEARASWPRGPLPLPAMQGIDLEPLYPAAARAAGHEGDVHMDVSVDALGKVTGCSVAEGSMSPDLDKAACAVMRSDGAFEPALDSVGKPTSGVVPALFRWVLPRADGAGEEAPRALRKFPMTVPGSATMSVLVDAEGKASDCSFTGELTEGAAVSPCDMFGGKQRYIPFRDANGNPVGKRVTFRSELKIEDAATTKEAAPPSSP
ncbi:MAG: TonB family protein [Sphingopyxis sp.]|nr:TonB family protein [Sphingopyxis sp.]